MRRSLVAVSALLAIGIVTGNHILTDRKNREQHMSAHDIGAIVTADRLDSLSRKLVFFGHQSVGENVLSGVPQVYRELARKEPSIVGYDETSQKLPSSGIVHAKIGKNRDPESKIRQFDEILRAGVAARVDVAVIKLCYVDVTAKTDVPALFALYRSTLEALERDYPDVKFVASTVPLTKEGGPMQWLVGRFAQGAYDSNANVSRERFNHLVREAFSAGRVFDIAAAESTYANGERAESEEGGAHYYYLTDEYAADPGHLNATGSVRAAAAFLASLT